jgi:hypothetical protein
MKSQEFISEITKLRRSDYSGGKEELPIDVPKRYVPLPGGSGLAYAVQGKKGSSNIHISIIDPKADPTPPEKRFWELPGEYRGRLEVWQRKAKPGAVIGELALYQYKFPIDGAYRVSFINVSEDYRGMGVAKSLYGIALSILKIVLVAGDSQTPGGRRNWLSLANIPGVEVKGVTKIDDDIFGPKRPTRYPLGPEGNRRASDAIEKIMASGADYLGLRKDSYGEQYHYFAFPVAGKGSELAPAIKKTFDVYTSNWGGGNMLYAVWTGR